MSAGKPIVFYFNFSFDDDEERTLGFIVGNPEAFLKKIGCESFEEFDEGIYDIATESIESNFGVHDWSSSPNDAVDAIGYTTYEVEKEQVEKLMNTWREWFLMHDGEPTAVVEIDGDALNGDDLAIYEHIRTKA